LGNNNLKGSLEAKLVSTLGEIFKLKNLESLVLSDNEIAGTSLKKFKKLNSLKTLLLNNCKLSGKIPESALMKLKKLSELDLNDSCFSTKVERRKSSLRDYFVASRLKKWLDEINPGWDETQTACFGS
jgi:Leucine-rich repeat (LRR) protein